MLIMIIDEDAPLVVVADVVIDIDVIVTVASLASVAVIADKPGHNLERACYHMLSRD